LALQPNDADLDHYRGVARYNSRQFKSALEDFDRAIALDSSKPEYRTHRDLTQRALRNGK
jgi:hypothetical protein